MTIISLDFYLNKQLFSFNYQKTKKREKKDNLHSEEPNNSTEEPLS